MNDLAASLALLVAFIAGGLTVYIYFAARPGPLEEPIDVYPGGVRIQQVSGFVGARLRVLLALAALVACGAFLAGALFR